MTHLMLQVHDFNIFFDAPHIVSGDLPSLAVAACARPACLSVESVGGGDAKYSKYLSFSDGIGEIFR